MITVKAKIEFQDYKENRLRKIGDTFEVTQDRLDEILTKGGDWVEVVEEEKTDLSKLTKKELEKLAKEYEIEAEKTKGATKEELIDLIEQVR